MDHLAHHGVACPTPVRARDGEALRELCGRPAAIVTFLTGMWPRRIDPFHCAGVGGALARLHRAGESFAMTRPNDLGPAGWRRLYEACRERADEVQPGLAAEIGDGAGASGGGMAAAICRPGSSMPICFPTTCFFATAS